MNQWALFRHKNNHAVKFWVKATGEVAKQHNGRYIARGEVVDIRTPVNAFGYGGGGDKIRPPRLSAHSGQMMADHFYELYEEER